MYRLVRCSVLTACLLLVQVSALTAGTPQAVSIQGFLEDQFGNPISDGMHGVILSGWDDSTGGSLLWTENKVVITSSGHFALILDGAGPTGMLLHSGQQFMQVQVTGEAPMVPRIRMASVPSALLTTRMDGDVSTQPGELVVRPAGDPDFDLLRIAALDSTASITMGGDPDFDLLRISGGSTGASMVMQGDPDFDLLRITGVDSTGTVAIGDPDFDLLRMTSNPSGSSMAIGGDPDFDLLRISGGSTGASMVMQGDPDFDLLRITGVDSTGTLAIGDPDFDLLRMTASPTSASLAIGDPDFDLLRLTSDNTGGSIAIDEEGVQVINLHGGGGGGGGGGGIAIGEEGVQVVKVASDSGGSSIAIEEEGVQRMLIHSDSAGGGIAVNEEGIEFAMDIREMTTGLDVEYRIGNDLDGDGVPGGSGIAIEEEGHQRLKAFVDNGGVVIVLDGVTQSLEGAVITMGTDSTGGGIAIDEEGVQVVRMQSGTSSSAGGGGGGGIAIGEEGVQIVRCEADSASSRIIAGKGIGDGDAVLTCDASGAVTRYLRSSSCGASQISFGTDGMTMQCTPGGSTTPDTAVRLDPDGHMAMAGDLTVGGDICAVGNIGVCSDARYKTDVSALHGALASLGRIRGVNFNWRTDEFPDKSFRTDRDFGFIAQELKEVVPQVVTLGKDGYYSVDYGRLTPLLVEAVKELDARTARIDQLEARLSEVEKASQIELVSLTERLAQLETQLAKLASGASSTQADVTLADAK